MTAVQSPPEPTLGIWMREIREALDLNQKELAELMAMPGVNQMTISRWERSARRKDGSVYVPDVFEMRRFAKVTGAEYVLDLRILPSRWTDELLVAA